MDITRLTPLPASIPTIERVETLLLDLPTIRPHRLSVATMTGQTVMLLRLHCSDGFVGLGEGTTIAGLSYGAESPEGIKQAIDLYFAPHLLGARADRVQWLMTQLGKAVKFNHFAKCAIETALLDAQAKRLGVPLSELLGGRQRDSLPVAWTLASGDTGRDIAEAEHMLDLRRHRVFKLKIGRQCIAADIAHVRAIKQALGEQASLRVDVNMAWSELETAQAMPALLDAGCELVEQPVATAAELARLMRRFPLALMADEVLHGPESAFELARNGGADAFAIKIEQSGGLFAAQRVAAIADAAGIGLYGGTMLEAAIATIAAAQLFSTFPKLQWGTELFGPLLLTEDILAQPLGYQDFHLQLPTGPGLGLELDEERITAFRRDRPTTQVAISAP